MANKSEIPHIGNIGEGDKNADWIKRVRNGASNRNELRSHARLKLRYAEESGDALAAQKAQQTLAELGEEDEPVEPYSNESSSQMDGAESGSIPQTKPKSKEG